MLYRRVPAVLATLVIVLVGTAANDGLASAGAATKPLACSTKGLSLSYKSGSATYSVKVSGLKTIAASCSLARSLASSVAAKHLHRKPVPATLQGFAVHVRSPCSGCTPVWRVTATHGSAKITFELLGGA